MAEGSRGRAAGGRLFPIGGDGKSAGRSATRSLAESVRGVGGYLLARRLHHPMPYPAPARRRRQD